MANRTSLTVIQLNDSHAYFDLHQEMFWQGGQALPATRRTSRHVRRGIGRKSHEH